MAYWWVSQNQTFRQERTGGYMWAPKRDKAGNTVNHWETMTGVAPGDVIFSYVGQAIGAIGVARTAAYDAPRPTEFGAAEVWKNDGRRVDVAYEIIPPVPLADFIDEIAGLLPQRNSPITSVGGGTQGYLFALPAPAASVLLGRLSAELDTSVDETIEHAIAASVPDKTERVAIGKARIGQGKFREDLVEHWSGKCALTGFDVAILLRASHIKPWCDSNNAERLDVMNGLLLAPGCDAAFDKRLISFENDGTMLISPSLSDQNLAHLGLDRRTKLLGATDGHKPFLAHHRDLFHNPPRRGRR